MKTRAFTLIELLVVIAIIAAFAALLFPVMSAIKARARSTTCASNLHQLYVGIDLYASDHGDWRYAPATIDLVRPLVSTGVFRCPEHEPKKYAQGFRTKLLDVGRPDSFADFPISYAYIRNSEPVDQDRYWARVLTHPSIGILSCPFHGSVNQDFSSPALGDLQPRTGAINRVCVDGHMAHVQRTEKRLTAVQDLFYNPMIQPAALFKDEP